MQVSGHTSSGTFEVDMSVQTQEVDGSVSNLPKFTEKLWAYLTIKKLLQDIEKFDDVAVTNRSKQKALELSLKVTKLMH